MKNIKKSIKVIFSSLAFIVILKIANAQESKSDLPYVVNKGVIYADKGIPESPRWFADSRLAFSFDEEGIAQVDYYNPVRGERLPTIFLRQLWDGFRYYLEKNNKTFKPQYLNSRVWPFGIESEWSFENVIFKHRVMAINESVIIQVIVPENVPPGIRFKMEFYEAFGLTKGSEDDLRFSNGDIVRKWDKWKFETGSNILEGGFKCFPTKQQVKNGYNSFHTLCMIGAGFPMEHILHPINPKHILKSPELEAGKTYSFFISFEQLQSKLLQKNQRLINEVSQIVQHQFERYQKVADNSPVLKSAYTGLNNFISLAPMYHESLKITDHPGAMRAKTSNYWVWGWDGLTCNDAIALWGDVLHIKEMLQFYEATADKQKGIGHAFEYDMTPASISALPAQGMYISLLQLYYVNTGDMQLVKNKYGFAKKIFKLICKSEVAGTGFCKGTSLFPDFPEAMSETGNDISGFNNTIFYCAARSMEWLAALTGDEEQQKKARSIIDKFERNFIPLFFNKEKKFVVSSIDSKTLNQRNSYNTNSIKWENNYCADITDSINIPSLQFFKENAITPMGLREIPLWNKSYDMDANQLHCWWPATGEYFMRLINGNDQKPLIDQWVKWVSYWTKHLTCPEGISYYIETDEPEFDRWTSQKGTWQAYSMRGWYQAAMHGVIGVSTDAGGITFYPYSGEEMTLSGLNYMNKKFDIEMKGSGAYIESIVADGVVIKGTNKLPADMYADKQRIKIIVNRVAKNPYPLSVKAGIGIDFYNYTYADGIIKATINGAGLCRLKLNAGKPPAVKLDGKIFNSTYNPDLNIATVELNLKPGKFQKIEIY
ncbi:MAG TPA: hypothetical protein VGP55_03115 [Chitinophagaceae bacterium]|nr:hypothetical protein [Chitinophagaceae bacterium]